MATAGPGDRVNTVVMNRGVNKTKTIKTKTNKRWERGKFLKEIVKFHKGGYNTYLKK
jgi:hypothetical protein